MNQKELSTYVMGEVIPFIKALDEFIPEIELNPKDTEKQLWFRAGKRALVRQLNSLINK